MTENEVWIAGEFEVHAVRSGSAGVGHVLHPPTGLIEPFSFTLWDRRDIARAIAALEDAVHRTRPPAVGSVKGYA